MTPPHYISNVPLPDWKQGTDRQRGRRLFQYLQKTGQAPKRLRRVKGQLQPMNRLSDLLLKPELIEPSYKLSTAKPPAGEIDARLETALRLAAQGEFVAAGAVYFLVGLRLSPETRRNKVRERRQKLAHILRLKKTSAACEKAIRIERLVGKLKRPLSSNAISKKLKIPASTVRRLRNAK